MFRRLWTFFILLCLLAPGVVIAETWPTLSSAPNVKGEGSKDAAIVIGIEDYVFAPDVLGARKNADDWYQYLVESRRVPGGSVELLRDHEASREMIIERAKIAASKVKRGGTLWIVYIGHGAPAKDGEGGVFVGVDAQQTAASLYARSLSERELIEVVSGGEQAHTMMVVDACFSGKISGGEALAKNLQPLLLVKAVESSVTILSAGGNDEFAGPLPESSRPAFSYLILGAMRGWGDENADGKVTAKEATTYARTVIGRVVKDRIQTPQIQGPDGDFALSRGGDEAGPDITKMVLGASVAIAPAPLGVAHIGLGDQHQQPPNEYPDRLPTSAANTTDLSPQRADSSAQFTLGITSLGLGAMLILSGGVSHYLAASTRDQIVPSSNGLTENEAQTLQSEADLYDTMGIIMWSAGSLSVLRGIYHLATIEDDDAIQVVPVISDQMMMLSVGGQF